MDREQAILTAQMFRWMFYTMPADGSEAPMYHETRVPSVKSFDKRGQLVNSISAAKRYTRGSRCVVARDNGEWKRMLLIAAKRRWEKDWAEAQVEQMNRDWDEALELDEKWDPSWSDMVGD